MLSIMSKIARIATSHRGVASVRNQNFDYFLVLDFEATCDRDRKLVPQVSDISVTKRGILLIYI